MAGPIEGRAAWRKGNEAKRMREASLSLLETIVTCGYAGYRHPLEQPGDMGKTMGWTYEQVEPRERIAAAKELLDRTDGKPRQEITGEDGGAIKLDASAGLLETLKRLAGE